MASTIGMPRSGLLCLLASALFLSVFGRPVAESFVWLSQTRLPHSAPPQFTIRTWLPLSRVNQGPSAWAARAGATVTPTKTAAARHTAAAAVVRRIVMNHLTLLCPWAGTIVDVIRLA